MHLDLGRYQLILVHNPRWWGVRRQGVWPNPNTIERQAVKVPLFRWCQLGPVEVRRFNLKWPGVAERTKSPLLPARHLYVEVRHYFAVREKPCKSTKCKSGGS